MATVICKIQAGSVLDGGPRLWCSIVFAGEADGQGCQNVPAQTLLQRLRQVLQAACSDANQTPAHRANSPVVPDVQV